jgi:hypothetical protein
MPNEILIQRYASSYAWDKEKLAAVLSQFGPLPDAGQEQLIRCLYLTFGRYQLAAKTIRRVTPGERQKQLERIEAAARKLLLFLDDGPFPAAWLEQAGVNTHSRNASIVNAELAEAHAEIADSIIALRKLHKRAKEAAEAAAAQVDHKRGGTRHHPGAEGQLIRDAIAIYRHMRGQHPVSGNEPGIGEPMLKFVRTVGALFGVEITNDAIEEAWRTRDSNSK